MKTFSMKSSPQSSSGMNRWGKKLPLCEAYPVNSIIELTLEPNGEVISGLVYCTDDVSNSIVLKRSHRNTPVTSDVQIVNVSSIRDKKIIRDLAASTESTDTSDQEVLNVSDEISVPILVVSKKEVEEIEKRAAKIAEETFHHINQKVSLLCWVDFLLINQQLSFTYILFRENSIIKVIVTLFTNRQHLKASLSFNVFLKRAMKLFGVVRQFLF